MLILAPPRAQSQRVVLLRLFDALLGPGVDELGREHMEARLVRPELDEAPQLLARRVRGVPLAAALGGVEREVVALLVVRHQRLSRG